MLKKYLIKETAKIKDCLKLMQENGQRCVIITDDQGKLKGTFSDGDFRRLILKNINFNSKVKNNYHNKNFSFVEKKNYSLKKIKNLFLQKNLTLIPIVDNKKKVIHVETWSNFFNRNIFKDAKRTTIVVSAGGKGTRLIPYTSILPKPLIPINNIPMIEYVIRNFRKYNYTNFVMTVNHKANLIKTYFQERYSDFTIDYVEEKKPLGTAGGLKNIDNLSEDFFLINCDTLIDVNYDNLLKNHKLKKSDLTIVTCKIKTKSSYGICYVEKNNKLINFKEKPENNNLINTGFYILNKKILKLINKNKYCDFDEIIRKCMKKNFNVQTYEIHKTKWKDLGTISELQKMN
jgi:dTDP-glucose pyrophosphorylase